jgi:hypothetical protein
VGEGLAVAGSVGLGDGTGDGEGLGDAASVGVGAGGVGGALGVTASVGVGAMVGLGETEGDPPIEALGETLGETAAVVGDAVAPGADGRSATTTATRPSITASRPPRASETVRQRSSVTGEP